MSPSPRPLPTRQVHLDFHTSEHMPGVGSRFSKKQWQDSLRLGRVNQINVFAKCHHSWSYYPTKVGKTHPTLEIDLLGAQLEASHGIGVVSPIYYTVGWSAMDAEVHPDWCVRERSGAIHTAGPWNLEAKPEDEKPWGWKWMCAVAGGPYHRHILEQVEEICRLYPVDGFFFDIYGDNECHCDACKARMAAEGVDASDPRAVIRSYTAAMKAHTREVKALILRHHPAATVFFNGLPHVGDTERFHQRLFEVNTQQELEDLPTTWGGYDKLPLEAKYHLGQGSKVLAMSGKFHKSWGEFGGFKHPDAIRYEAAAMIAQGVCCNFGDHMHPVGELDAGTYGNLGQAFEYVEKIEAFGPGGLPYSRLGLWLTLCDEADRGAATLLLELHRDFVIADEANLASLGTLVLPSQAVLTEGQAKAIQAWVTAGGRLFVFGEGALNLSKTRSLLDLGVEYLGPSEYKIDYTVAGPELAEGLVPTPFLNYKSGLRTRLTGAAPLAMVREPYFNRSYGKYCGHANTPYRLEDSPYPAVAARGNTVFVAHPLDRLYLTDGVRLHRDLVGKLLRRLDPHPVFRVEGLPSSGRINLLHQKDQGRFVAHLLYSPVLQRGSVKVIEDFPPIAGVRAEFRLPEKVRAVRAIPSGEALPFRTQGEAISVEVPTFAMHTALVLEYGL
ncbi:MAG: hypothetical protein J0L75_13210 [Spirochaetes bacterium]|nr:hypothetical protein [Spirochaetota bacterium]